MRKLSLCLLLCSVLCIAGRPGFGTGAADVPLPSPAQDGTLPALTAIAGQGLMDIHAYQELEDLSDTIGGRVTGSLEAAAAVNWGLATMRKLGLQNVRAEFWQLDRGWTRISATGELLSPIHRPLRFESLGWVGSTPDGGADYDVVTVNSYNLDEEIKTNSSKWAGKVLLMVQKGEPPKDHFATFEKMGIFLEDAYKAHAVAVIGGQGGGKSAGMNLTHTGVPGFGKFYDIPVVSTTEEDEAQIERFLDAGKTVRLHINVQNRTTDHPVESANVMGEIPGAEHPEQIVVVGGHLDSWDLAEGATDDGMGVATALGAAEAILKSGFKPRRTLRFVLFTGEEQGLLGSFAYCQTHKAEMANHLGAVILDNGQGPVTALNLGGHQDLIPAVKGFVTCLGGFGEIKVNDNTVFGTDAGPFIVAGLPGINMGQDSPEYRYTHHSEADTFDKVKQSILDQDSALMALTAFWIADRPDRLATPWPPERTAKMLVEKKDDKILKLFDLWPFGNLGEEKKENPSATKP
jgi:carboxypeptidase Q